GCERQKAADHRRSRTGVVPDHRIAGTSRRHRPRRTRPPRRRGAEHRRVRRRHLLTAPIWRPCVPGCARPRQPPAGIPPGGRVQPSPPGLPNTDEGETTVTDPIPPARQTSSGLWIPGGSNATPDDIRELMHREYDPMSDTAPFDAVDRSDATTP